MRLLTLFMTLLSAVVGLTLNKTDGTTIELGDQPTVIDLRNVIMPARALVTESNIHSNLDVADVNTANWDRLASNVRTRYRLSSIPLTTAASLPRPHQLPRQCDDVLPL